MENDIRSTYHVEKHPTNIIYEYQLGLKNNEEYENRFNESFIKIVELFSDRYKGVKIEPPKGREKSQKSLKEKLNKLEIERLCKIYAINDISVKEKENLYSLILDKMPNKELAKKTKKIFYEKIEDLSNINELIQEKEVSDNMKTACLRITKIRLNKEEIDTEKRNKLIQQIEKDYGEKAAKDSNIPEKNLLHWECIEKIKNDENEIKRLYNPLEYLKIKDLRGFKIVIANVPNDLKTENKKLNELIKQREQASAKEKTKYNDLCCIEVEKDFANYLTNNKELLKDMNIELLKDGYKRKTKNNGYIADHLKFCYLDHKEYNFELQIRSIYRENISRANGTAAHDKRSGKKRILPDTSNKNVFLKELNYMLPKYTILEKKNKKYSLRKCNTLESMMEFYLGYIQIDSEEYKKIMNYLKEEKEQKK
ncbi:MAG: hypothetical protein GX682_01020 [Clostridiaceae bacterium]|nr:hypothetical protein [Clostridiaceae bacterium]